MECNTILAVTSKMTAMLFLHPRKTWDYVGKVRIQLPYNCGIDDCDKGFIIAMDLVEKIRNKKHHLNTLETEYTTLFVSSYPNIKCPPYESYYTEPDAFLAKEQVVKDINAILNSLGLEVDKKQEKMPDHIITELELLGILLAMPPESGANTLLEALIRKHLLVWLLKFSSCIKTHATQEYYKKLAQILECMHGCFVRLYGAPLILPK